MLGVRQPKSVLTFSKRMNRIEAGIKPEELPFVRFTLAERDSLRQLAGSADSQRRRLCIDYLWRGIIHRQNFAFLIEMCDRLIPDRSQYVRWQSLLLMGQFAETEPELIWPLTVKYGTVENKDIRIATACCVLEHILQHHFSKYFARVRRMIEGGNRRLGYTLSHCYKYGEAEEPQNSILFDRLAGQYRKRVSNRSKAV